MFKLIFVFGIFLNPYQITAMKPAPNAKACLVEMVGTGKVLYSDRYCIEIVREISKQLREQKQ